MVSDLVVFCPVLTVVLSLSSCSNRVVVLSSKSKSMSLPPSRSMSCVHWYKSVLCHPIVSVSVFLLFFVVLRSC